jgi:hypothetical protein
MGENRGADGDARGMTGPNTPADSAHSGELPMRADAAKSSGVTTAAKAERNSPKAGAGSEPADSLSTSAAAGLRRAPLDPPEGEPTLDELKRDYARALTIIHALRTELDAVRAAVAPPTWQPIATLTDRVSEMLFWVVPKTPDETYVDTSNHAIFSTAPPRIHRGTFGTWDSLSKALYFHALPAPPAAPPMRT